MLIFSRKNDQPDEGFDPDRIYKMTKILKGRVAIVTGSGMGIGRAIALHMAAEGASVVTNNRMPRSSGGDAQSTADEIKAQGGNSIAYFGDVSDFSLAAALVKTAIDYFGRVDILVNNAGAEDKRGNPWEMAPEDWERTIRSHLTAPFYCIRHASGYMKDQGWGRIVNTTSRAWIETTEQPNYAAAMAGVVGLTRDVARDMGRFGVTCNAYSPFAKTRRTNIAKQERAYAAGVISKSMYEMYLNVPEPASCAPFVTYLCSEESANINGLTFGMKPHELFVYSEKAEAFSMRKEDGDWSHEELVQKVPANLLVGYVNPAPKK